MQKLKKKTINLIFIHYLFIFSIYKHLKILNNLYLNINYFQKSKILLYLNNLLNIIILQIKKYLHRIILKVLIKTKLNKNKIKLILNNIIFFYNKYYIVLSKSNMFLKLFYLNKFVNFCNLKFKYFFYQYLNYILNVNFFSNYYYFITNKNNNLFNFYFKFIVHFNLKKLLKIKWLYIYNHLLYINDYLLYNWYLLFNSNNYKKLNPNIVFNNIPVKINQISYILLNRYFDYINEYNQMKNYFLLNFYKKNISRDSYVKKLVILKDSIKIFKNSIYFKKYYPFISLKFFKKYLDIILIWFLNNTNKSKFNLIYRNIYIMYVKHLNFSFFNKYINWINKSKKFVITLNINITKNNLFYTLINKKGFTIANLSVGLFYLLPRNKNLKKNPFKKSVGYLTYEMFSMIFYNKFIFPLQYFKKEKKFNYFKISYNINNSDSLIEWRSKSKLKKFYRKKYKAYFIFKFLRQKYFFPGLSKNVLSFIGKKNIKWRRLYQFVGVYKMYPRVHNGCRKKKKRRL